MQNASSLLARDDTFFGVCQALGDDFGFNPNWLRAALAVALFASPLAVLIGYCVAGAIVALSRWLAPDPRPAASVEPIRQGMRSAAPDAGPADHEKDVAIAA